MFIVIEIQTNNGVVSTVPFAFETRNEAEAKYHAILAIAATSAVEVHSCVLLNSDGTSYKCECFRHNA